MTSSRTNTAEVEVAIIGAGPGGIAAAIKLIQAGVTDLALLERDADVGGSWHQNDYPGIGVDVPAFSYQYSFARNARWSRLFPKGDEVKQYHVDVAHRFGVYERTRFHTSVEREQWDDVHRFWRLYLADGSCITARFIISAVGAFVRPRADVGIDGVESFRGKVLRPTDWDHDYALGGKSVAIIGTGASAVQIVPSIARVVDSLSVFQRTPVWSLPKPDFTLSGMRSKVLGASAVQATLNGCILVIIDLALRGITQAPLSMSQPALRHFDRLTIRAYRHYVRRVVNDGGVAAKLSPSYGVFAKRPTISNRYLQSFNRHNVELITKRIERITPRGIRTTDGVEHVVDALVLATGYEVFSDPETYRSGTVIGRDGFDLADFYAANGLQAYESVSVAGLPNRWTLCGPYSWTGSGWHAFMEMSSDHAVRAIVETRRRGAASCEVRAESADAYHRRVLKQSRAITYYMAELNAHVPTYYRNSQGHSTYIRPAGYFAARRRSRSFPLDDYRFERTTQQLPA